MNRTEAAAIVADNIAAWCARHDVDDRDLCQGMGGLLIAEALSRMEHETVPGSYAHAAALLRPSDRSVRIAYRRRAGLID